MEIDHRSEKIGYKIREARNERVPYMLIIGEKEENDKTVALRSRENGDEGSTTVKELVDRISKEVANKDM